MFRVYLAGSIQEEKEGFCREWRNKVEKRFKEYSHIEFINPIKDKDLSEEYDPKRIFEEDIRCINKSDLVIVEMDCPDYHYIGSSIEIHHAWRKDIPVIVWGKAHSKHYFLRYLIERRVETFEPMIDIIYKKYHDHCLIFRDELDKEE